MYSVTGMNARQQITSATHGSSLNSTFGFDSYGYPSSANTGSIRSYTYSFNSVTGNLGSRRNVEISTTEEFTYDNLDRLLTATGGQSLTMTYNANGNIATKNDLGSTSFGYNNTSKPYALTDIEATTGLISDSLQTATYTSFEQVSTIDEGDYLATFTYNSDGQRARMLVTELGSAILTRWYVGSRYIKETEGSTTRQYTWLGGDAYTAPVVAVTQSGTTTYYYLLRDHLGTITHLVNTSNTVVSKYSFDAWGRRRVADDWEDYDVSSEPALFAGRGFTAHEYLEDFKLYNMNGRLYDPVVGRFLNADPVIQNPGFTQSYNRYSYCMNNPLKYVDPSGYLRINIEAPWLNPSAYKLFYTGFGSGGGSFSGGGGDSSYGNTLTSSSTSSTIWIQLGFFYYDDKGNPTTFNGVSGEFWIYEATLFDSDNSNNRTVNALASGEGDYSVWQNAAEKSGYVSSTLGGLGNTIYSEYKGVERWVGKNGNYYNSAKVRMNGGYARSAQLAKSASMTYKVAGHSMTALSVGFTAVEFAYSDKSGGDYARLVSAGIGVGLGFVPVIGPGLGIIYGIADSAGAFDGIYDYFDQ